MANQVRELLINLTTSGSVNAGKALRMGRKFTGAGWRVHLFLNVDAVELINPDANLQPCPISGKPLPGLLESFVSEGGQVLVGGECLKAIGLSGQDLPAGCIVADFAVLETLLSQPDIKILGW